jgi:hypothetical protein
VVSGFGRHFGAPRGALLIMAGLSLDLLVFLGSEAGVLNPRGSPVGVGLYCSGFFFSIIFSIGDIR